MPPLPDDVSFGHHWLTHVQIDKMAWQIAFGQLATGRLGLLQVNPCPGLVATQGLFPRDVVAEILRLTGFYRYPLQHRGPLKASPLPRSPLTAYRKSRGCDDSASECGSRILCRLRRNKVGIEKDRPMHPLFNPPPVPITGNLTLQPPPPPRPPL